MWPGQVLQHARGVKKPLLVAVTALTVLAVVVALFALFLWPVGALRQGTSARERVDTDMTQGYRTARPRTEHARRLLLHDYPELGGARYSWQEIGCSIEDSSAQLAFAEYAEVCTLRAVWMVQVHRSRWDDCSSFDSAELGQDADYSVVQARASMIGGPHAECPVTGGTSGWQTGSATTRVVSGHRPATFGNDSSWEVFTVDVLMSYTMIGCKPAWVACRPTFDEPRMTVVKDLRRS